MLAMLGQMSGKTALDLGCGEVDAARSCTRGAHVTAVDGSLRLIEVARQRARAESLDVRFLHANANALHQLASDAFDVVVASMSLMDIEDYSGAISEVRRGLRSGGALVMSITHPCFSAPVSRWVPDGGGSLEVFAVDRYFDRIAWPAKITSAFRARCFGVIVRWKTIWRAARARPATPRIPGTECDTRRTAAVASIRQAHPHPVFSVHALDQGLSSTRQLSCNCLAAWPHASLQPGVFRLCLREDRNVRVGGVPECEKTLERILRLRGLSRQNERSGQLKPRQRTHRIADDNSGMIQNAPNSSAAFAPCFAARYASPRT